ncbi:UDP-glycosyltransferase UGT5-like isoform X2 [Periplaneta americana]
MKTTFLLFIFTYRWLTAASGARILAIFPYIGKSHFNAFEPFIKELAARGHQLVVVSHFPQKHAIANYTDISLVGSIKIESTNRVDIGKFSGLTGLKTLKKELSQYYESCDKMLSFHTIQELMKSDMVFDLVISESFFSDCFLPFVDKFKVPNIAMSSCLLLPWTNDRMANPDNPAFVPTLLTPFLDKMSLSERIMNTVTNVGLNLFFFLTERFVTENYVHKHFGESVPKLYDLARNTSLVLVNTHFSLNRPHPLVPGVVEVGGLHIRPPKKLPKDLEDYLDGAEHGLILFSMGSMLRADSLPADKRDAFLQAFSELPQRVLWKWEMRNMPLQPENVKTAEWLPQFDIINHPNVRLYLGHGGLLGTTEAVYAGVPMVGIPMFGDQAMNVKAIEVAGMGLTLDLNDITKENVLRVLRTVLYEPSYRENAKRMSKVYQDRPMSAMDTAIYWTEYVIRHKGAPHLRTAALDLAWYQYFLLDVLAVIMVCVTILLFVTYVVLKKLTRGIFSPKPKNKLKLS